MKNYVKTIKALSIVMMILLTVNTVNVFAQLQETTPQAVVVKEDTKTLEELGYKPDVLTIDKLNEKLQPVELELPNVPFDVTCSSLNVRKEPNIDSDIIDSYKRGTQFYVLGIHGDWFLTPKGWVHSNYTQRSFKTIVKDKNEIYRPKTKLNTSLDAISGLTVDQIRQLLKGTTYQHCAEAFHKYEKKYNVNVLFALALARHESDFGRSRMARQDNNIFGIVGRKYSSKEECINYWYGLIRRRYINRGLTTIGSIGPVYCTDGTAGWLSNVESIMNSNIRAAKTMVD